MNGIAGAVIRLRNTARANSPPALVLWPPALRRAEKCRRSNRLRSLIPLAFVTV
jgi:hypothetical protein